MENKVIANMNQDEIMSYQNTLEEQLRECLNKLTTAELDRIKLQREISKLNDKKKESEEQITRASGDSKIINSLLRECKNRYWQGKNQ